MLTLRYRLQPQDEGLTLRAVLRERMGLSYAQARALGGTAYLNGRSVYLNQRAVAGDVLTVPLPPEETGVEPAQGEVRALYEDDALLAVFKPAGIETHPHRGGVSMLNLALGFVRSREPSVCLHPVHRLDAGTQGILLFAKHGCVQAMLMRQMCRGGFVKEYEGIARGRFAPPAGAIHLPVAHDPARGPARCVSMEGKAAWTDYETLSIGAWRGLEISRVRFTLRTGRTHQIRVHAGALGCPLLGDALYGGACEGLSSYALCAVRLCFEHPLTGIRVDIRISAPWDPGFSCMLNS